MIKWIQKVIKYIKWLYMQYLLNTALYMLEPSEIHLFNFFFVFILITVVYSTYVFAPPMVLAFINWFLRSDNESSSKSEF
jgi:hypothetical protein